MRQTNVNSLFLFLKTELDRSRDYNVKRNLKNPFNIKSSLRTVKRNSYKTKMSGIVFSLHVNTQIFGIPLQLRVKLEK